MNIGQLKEVAPLLDSYEFKKYNFYMFIIKPEAGISMEVIAKLKAMLNEAKIRHVFIIDSGEGLKVFELKPDERGL